MKHGAALREALDAAALAAEDDALSALLEALQLRGYAFVIPNNRTYRILRRRDGPRQARTLRDVLGWNLPYRAGAIDPEVEALLACAGRVAHEAGLERAALRVSSVGGHLFLHSPYGAGRDTVFLGPDTYRFAGFLRAELQAADVVEGLLDVGTGAGVGGILAAGLTGARQVTLADINVEALRLAALNARHAGVRPRLIEGTGLDGEEVYDLIVANPPFIAGGGKTATDGGGKGTELSLTWCVQALPRLRPGGRFVLYTGAPIVEGHDALAAALSQAVEAAGCRLTYRELDPDIFSEDLRRAAYAGVERIAAIGAVATRPA